MIDYKISEKTTSSIKPQAWYKKYYSGFLNEDDIAEYVEVDTNISNYPNNIPKEDFFVGSWLVYSNINHYYLLNHNNIKDNYIVLKQCEEIIKLIKPCLTGEMRGIFQEEIQKFSLLYEILELGYCITPQLLYLFDLINSELEKIFPIGEEYLKIALPDTDLEYLYSYFHNPSTIIFDSFKLDMDEVIDLIRKNKRWQKLDRDLTIYDERQKGRILQDIADDFNIGFTAVCNVEKKVTGAINHYKGKIFETFVKNLLVQSHKFSEVKLEGDIGEPDILAYSKDRKELYVYSLKNLKIDRTPYWLTKDELRPELERAMLCSLDYEIHLILLVFDNFHNQIKQFQIDYNSPENIDISI